MRPGGPPLSSPARRSGRALADGYALEGPLVTELAHDGDSAAIGVLELIGTRLGVAISNFVNIFNPEVVVIGGGVMAAGDLLLEPARAVVAERPLPPPREEVRIVPADFGVEAGMVGAAALAFEGLGEPVRPREHERPPRHLPHPDREPRGRDAPGPRRAPRRRHRRLRGHAAHPQAARSLRRQRAAWSATTSTTSARGLGELVDRMRAGAVVALVSDAGTPLVSDPGFVLVQACVAAGLAVEVLPGPSAALAALVASALPADRWRFAGFLPRKRAELERVLSGAETLVAFESPRRVAASLAVLAELDPERPVAVARELTKIHEEVVRGSAAELAARYASEPPRGEVVLVVGGARGEAPPDTRPGDRRGATPRRRGRQAARRRVGGRASSPGRRRIRSIERSPASDNGRADSHVLLHHHPHLLRQRPAPPGPRVHDDRRRRARPAHAPARRGRLLPHRHRRARRAGGRRRPRPGRSSPRSSPTATPSASRR